MVIPNYEEVQAELREFTKRRPQLSFNTFQRFYRAFVYMRRGGVSFHHRTHDFLYDVLYDQGTGMEDTAVHMYLVFDGILEYFKLFRTQQPELYQVYLNTLSSSHLELDVPAL